MTDSGTNTLTPGHAARRGECVGVFYDGFWHKYTDSWSCCTAWIYPGNYCMSKQNKGLGHN